MRNGPKQMLYANSRLGLLQKVSEPDTGWCAGKDARPPRRMDCEIPHRLEKGMKHFL